MELKKINIKNFKKVSNVDLDLADLNILVGANSSGKSSILQAIHLASCLARQAKENLRRNNSTVISVNELDYLPTNNYKKLGNDNDWGNREDSPFSKVNFVIGDEEASRQITVNTEIRGARNAGISVKGNLPQEVSNLFRGQGRFFSAYIPGISGMPNEELKQSKRVVLKACSFGDANFYLRNALLLLTDDEVSNIEAWLNELIGTIKYALAMMPKRI